jgi:hypothetical protein
MTCRVLQEVCKTAAEVKRWGFDYVRNPATGTLGFLANGWRPGQYFPALSAALPTKVFTGLQYSSSGGWAGTIEPRWPATVGATITDGSITWTAEAVSNDSVKATIVDSEWDAPADITITDEQIENTAGRQVVSALIAGGTAGRKYEVKNTVTLSDGAVEVSILEVSVV